MQKSVKIALAVIILVLILGIGIYFFGKNPNKEQQPGEFGQMPPGNEQMPPGAGQQGEFMIPKFDANAPLPEWPAKLPKPQLVAKQLGSVDVTAYSTGIIRGMFESGIDYFITLKNTGISDATIYFSKDADLVKQAPSWNLHFFSMQDSPITLVSGEEKKLWYFLSLDKADEVPFTVTFKLWREGSSESIELPVSFAAASEDFRGKETTAIYGYVKDRDGRAVSNARVDAFMNCGRTGFSGGTDDKGRYAIFVLAMEDINAIYEGRELACDSTDYSVSATKDGYEFYFKSNIAPTRTNMTRLDITVEKIQEQDKFDLKWEKQVNEPYGFFWVKASDDWNSFAASQAKHPPQLDKPTSFYMFDSNGNILWNYSTGNECWGIDIAKDGSRVAAACHDNYIYSIDNGGSQLWKFDALTMTRSICLSNNGIYVLSGAIGNLYLFNAESGARESISWIDEWFRNCQFYQDDSGFVVGARTIAGFNINRYKLWSYIIGEFPMFLATDSSKNTFAAGKSRTLFSLDTEGNLRWKHRIPDHVITAGAATPDGSRIALGTIGGMVYLFDNSGNLLWKRGLATSGQFSSVGHNAIAISPDGKRIVAGTSPGNCIIEFNDKGTVVWQECSPVSKLSSEQLEGVASVQISSDKTRIIAGYGDSYIREFKKSAESSGIKTIGMFISSLFKN
ncbi:MAG: PQQ-binding-like beta-propeller repeat protein [archaeon]